MRKVLSFVLVLTLVLSSFSMAFAASPAGLTDIAGNANADAIQVAYDLEIVTGNPDGTFLPEKAVNRAEFAAMITRALAIPESALAGYATTSFKDTAGYGWAVPYLAFCQSKGIMLGDGNGNVMPGRTINMNEAITMALRAIGYTANSAELVGAWPSNYVTIGQNLGLYDDVAKQTNVNKAMAAQVIYNLLTVQKVVVNADGDTNWLWIDEDDDEPANLLNTNLGCTAHEDVVLGVDYTYDESVINITGKLGAYGTAYTDDDNDDKLVAFVSDSVALTGNVDGTDFEVGDVDYDFSTNEFTSASSIYNTDVVTEGSLTLDETNIAAFAAANTDDGDTVTINVELSGKKIKDIYSVVAWKTTTDDLAASDVQADIEDQELLDYEFVLDDNDDIDMASFQLVGADSLDAIAEDDVVYVYADDDNDIRKVAVGTETVEGVIDETDGTDTVTIGDKDYDVAMVRNAQVLDIPADLDVDSDGTFYLDVNGDIYDFDGTGNVDTYGVVKAASDETSFDNFKMRLYMSDDSTSTVYLADDTDEIDYVSGATDMPVAITAGALIGYSLDSNGDIDEIDDTVTQAAAGTVNFQSTKVLKVDGVSYSIDSNAVVFTYSTNTSFTSNYDVADLDEVEKGDITDTTYFILNDDDKVVAMFIEKANVDLDEDNVYGVFNSRRSVKNDDDDAVYKFTGFIDGAAFTKMTDDRTGFDNLITFGLYEITVDANDVITGVARLDNDEWDANDTDSESGYVALDKVIDTMNSDKTVITDTNGAKWTIADDAVVYKWNADDEEFTVSKLTSLRKDYTVSLYDTKGEDVDGVANVVVYFED